MTLSSCGPGELHEPTVTPSPTQTPTVTPTLAPTATPTASPTPEPVLPSVAHGLRPENAAAQTYEHDMWVVKNAEGLVTATWDAASESWVYTPEHITVKQTIIGHEVGDPTILEPFLGPLPPDDPETHFKDADGNPIGYGIGPEFGIEIHDWTFGDVVWPATGVLARFRGVTKYRHDGWKNDTVVRIFEVPRTADVSTILVLPIWDDGFTLLGTKDDRADWDSSTISPSDDSWHGDKGMQLANSQLVGNMAMLLVYHDRFSVSPHDHIASEDARSDAILSYLLGTSAQPPWFPEFPYSQNISPFILFPESVLPVP